jgi:hypothetical protein
VPDSFFQTIRENFWSVLVSAVVLYILWQALKPVKPASPRGLDVQQPKPDDGAEAKH